MKQKLLAYVKLWNVPYDISFVLMLCSFCCVLFSYDFVSMCILSGSIFIFGSIDMIIKNDKYYRIKRILSERYGVE